MRPPAVNSCCFWRNVIPSPVGTNPRSKRKYISRTDRQIGTSPPDWLTRPPTVLAHHTRCEAPTETTRSKVHQMRFAAQLNQSVEPPWRTCDPIFFFHRL